MLRAVGGLKPGQPATMSQFCPECQRCLQRRAADAQLTYECSCGFRRPAVPAELVISSGGPGAALAADPLNSALRASYDRTLQQVRQSCPFCDVPYLGQVVIGADMTVFLVCMECHRYVR